MFRRRHSDDFQYSFSSTIFVTNLSRDVSDQNKKFKTPKSKLVQSPTTSSCRQRSKSNENKYKTSRSSDRSVEHDISPKTPRGRKKKQVEEDVDDDGIVPDEPVAELDNVDVESSTGSSSSSSIGNRPGRVRRKSAKLAEIGDSDYPQSKTKTPKPKNKVLKNSKISDFFVKEPVPTKTEASTDPAAPQAELNRVKEEPEEIDPDLPYIHGVSWKMNAKCEAMDKDGNWYRSKMVDVSKEHKMVKIHFEGWKPKWDAWYMMETDMIRAASDWADMDSSKLRGTSWKRRIVDDSSTPKRKSVKPKQKPKPEPKTEPELEPENEPEVSIKTETETDPIETQNTSQESLEEMTEPYVENCQESELVYINELKLEVGARLEAQDKTNHWYRGKVVTVSQQQQVLKVHYDGWKSRWDTWYTMDSDRLRPLTRDWVDPRLLPKMKKKRKSKSVEQPVCSEEPSEQDSGEYHPVDVTSPIKSSNEHSSQSSSEMKSPSEQPLKKKRKRKSVDESEVEREPITTKIRLGASPEIINPDEKPKKTKGKKKYYVEEEKNIIEYLPEAQKNACVILEEVTDEDIQEPAVVPDEISYASLIGESRTNSPEQKSTKRSKRMKKERIDASDWVSEEVLDHVTSEVTDDLMTVDEATVDEAKPVKRKSLSTSEPDTHQESPKKKRGRPKSKITTEYEDNESKQVVKEVEKIPEALEDVLKSETVPKVEPVEEPVEVIPEKEKKKEKKVKRKKSRSRKSSAKESVSETDPDQFDMEPVEDSPPSEIDESEDYLPSGVKKMKCVNNKKGRPRKYLNGDLPLEKGAEWKKVGDDEFMDIPPPSSADFAVPLPRKIKQKKVKKFKKPKVMPEYTDAYNKAMLAMSIAEEKEKRKLERRLQRLMQKEIEEKTMKKKRRTGPSAYQLFCNHNRPRLMAQNPGASFALINRKLGETWHNIGEKEKSIWRRKSKKMKEKGTAVCKASSYAKQVKELSSLLKPGQKSVQGGDTVRGVSGDAGSSKITGTEPLDAAAHLKLLGESLGIIGKRLVDHQGDFAVQGTVSVMLDSFLCSLGPLMCLTTQVPEMDALPQKTLANTLDSIAYFMPGL